ncbi:MAG: DUF2993 domain-containing protein [Actinomycetota bacterium]
MRRLLVVLAVLAVLFVAADRGAAVLTERTVAAQLGRQLGGTASVRVHGFPFLTQLAAGDLRDVTVSVRGAQMGGRLPLAEADLALAGVRPDLARRTARVDRVTGTALLPFTDLARAVGGGVSLAAAGPDTVRVSRTVDVLGRPVAATATATVAVEQGALVATPQQVDLPGGLAALAPAVRAGLRVRVPLGGLPAGLTVTGVTVTAQGLRVTLAGQDVALSAGPSAGPSASGAG